jgi:PTH1 family peptidyl-tRNA hydrolase
MKYLIAGLGNIGEEYEHTRHNIGFDVLQYLANEQKVKFKIDRLAYYTSFTHKGRSFHLIQPTTFMNLSGKAVKYWMNELKISKENTLIVMDDLALPLGTLRMKSKGSDAGHNGLKNIALELGNAEYPRLKFGIGNEFNKGRQVNFVLGKFNIQENQVIEPKIKKAAEMILSFGTIGIERTMNFFNE